jgi:hypothetical protein
MNCKFCNAEIEDNLPACPVCGKDLAEEPAFVEQSQQETDAITSANDMPNEEMLIEEVAEQQMQDIPEENIQQDVQLPNDMQQPKKSVAPLVLSIVAAVLALASLAVLLMIALGVDFKSFLPRPNDIMNKDSYTVVDDKAVEKGDTVIATMGGKELTNAQLQIYYRMQVLDFLNYYGSYAEQLGLDMSLPLSEQTCYFEKDKTWEQYLLGVAIDTWQNYQVIALLAEEAGYQLSEEWQKSLEELPEELKSQATEGEFDSVDALLEDVIGPSCTEELYLQYVTLVYTCNAYYNTISENMTPNDDEIAAYFEENAASFAESGITKDMGNIADVRHILVCPKGGTTDETTGATTYSEDEWAACLAEAEKILDEWKYGEATEESFADLANTYTEDPGSATTGGLYEDIKPGDSYVENFLNWTIDMERKTGDTDIVKTEYGYHIMYYVGGEPYWTSVVGTQQLSDRITEMTDAAEEKWPMSVNYRKIALSELSFS